jgi:hypothetical protein
MCALHRFCHPPGCQLSLHQTMFRCWSQIRPLGPRISRWGSLEAVYTLAAVCLEKGF